MTSTAGLAGEEFKYHFYDATSGTLAYVSVIIPDDGLSTPHIVSLELVCPDLGAAEMIPGLHDLETALLELHGANIPPLEIKCDRRGTGKALLHLLLSGSVFSQLFSRMRKLTVLLHYRPEYRPRYYYPYEILSAPTHFTLSDVTISLSTAQRVEWLRCGYNSRNAYLHGLLRAAQEGAPAGNASPGVDTVDRVVAGRLEEDAEAEEQENKLEDAGTGA